MIRKDYRSPCVACDLLGGVVHQSASTVSHVPAWLLSSSSSSCDLNEKICEAFFINPQELRAVLQ